MPDVFLFLYAAVIGFVVAGAAAGVCRLATAHPMRFGANGSGLFPIFVAFVSGIVLGPVIIVRQAFSSAQAGDVPSSWAAAGMMVAVLWSCCIGIVILAVADSLRNSLT